MALPVVVGVGQAVPLPDVVERLPPLEVVRALLVFLARAGVRVAAADLPSSQGEMRELLDATAAVAKVDEVMRVQQGLRIFS